MNAGATDPAPLLVLKNNGYLILSESVGDLEPPDIWTMLKSGPTEAIRSLPKGRKGARRGGGKDTVCEYTWLIHARQHTLQHTTVAHATTHATTHAAIHARQRRQRRQNDTFRNSPPLRLYLLSKYFLSHLHPEQRAPNMPATPTEAAAAPVPPQLVAPEEKERDIPVLVRSTASPPYDTTPHHSPQHRTQTRSTQHTARST